MAITLHPYQLWKPIERSKSYVLQAVIAAQAVCSIAQQDTMGARKDKQQTSVPGNVDRAITAEKDQQQPHKTTVEVQNGIVPRDQ